MNSPPEWLHEVAVFDTETTGLDLREARIVTAAVAVLGQDGKKLNQGKEWLANPGIEIPTQASDVHGITTEFASQNGAEARIVIEDIIDSLRNLFNRGVPVVAYNAPYDFTILHYEAIRHGLEPISNPYPVLDPYVIDKQLDKYRKGKRTLSLACEVYGVTLDDAHTATADAIAAGLVLQAIARKFPQPFASGPLAIHQAQVLWSDGQRLEFETWMQGQGRSDFKADLGWPLKRFE